MTTSCFDLTSYEGGFKACGCFHGCVELVIDVWLVNLCGKPGRCRAHPLNTQEISSHHRQQENLSSFTFIPLSYRFPSHRTTRAHVRLLGPCFKTGRTGFPHKLTSHTSITSSTQPWKHPHALNPPSYEVRSKHEVVTTARQTHLLQWI